MAAGGKEDGADRRHRAGAEDGDVFGHGGGCCNGVVGDGHRRAGTESAARLNSDPLSRYSGGRVREGALGKDEVGRMKAESEADYCLDSPFD